MLAQGRRVAACTFALIMISSVAHAIVPRSLRRVDDDGTIAMTDTKGIPLRRQIRIDHSPRRPVAWHRFADAAGGQWTATWDHATAVPSRIWGTGIAVPGASADPDIAARAALALIVDHLDLLAPGADPHDFTLAANHWDGEMRSVGFVQRRGGLRVIGGQVSVRIKNDRIFVISSQALPDIDVSFPRAGLLADAELIARTRTGMDRELGLPATATVDAPGAAVILPLVGDDGVLGYRVTAPVAVDAGADGAWTAYVDPATGEVVARHQELSYVSAGEVHYDAVVRWTGVPRFNARAAGAAVTVNGDDTFTTETGGVVWVEPGAAQVMTQVRGAHAEVIDETGELATGSITVSPSGIGVWSAAADELVDAQINGFVHATIVQQFARDHFAGQLPFVYVPARVHVNIDDECNAYSNYVDIHFFRSSAMCENTARISDVVYHEYGHSIHHHAVIDGVGAFDGAMSEGASDFLAGSITEDPGMGRGFFHTNDALRDMDPIDEENIWPRDIGEVHFTGLIFAGTFWDLRKQLIDDLGPEAGKAKVLALYYAALQRSTDIPSSLIEALAADDTDGNLENGTPHECSIRDVFGRHGLRTVSGEVQAPGAVVAAAGETVAPIQIAVSGLSSGCSGDEVDRVDVGWRPGVGASPVAGGVQAVDLGGGAYRADLPLPDDGGRVDYQVQITFTDGNHELLPDNPADQYYQLYQGETVPLYCTDFETDPFAEGWRLDLTGVENFEWGEATAEHSATDPPYAYSGTHILGIGLGYDYADENSISINLPPIDVHQYSDVLLQYRRWLSVEDALYDHALIQANGDTVWTNYDTAEGSTHHIDREWRFQSIPLSARFPGPILNLTFRLDSDQGLHFGGWSIDDLCVVANPLQICGDGVRGPSEECDEGQDNSTLPDACRTNCRLATCGDGVLDTGEECEPAIDHACLPACIHDDTGGGGCCSTGGNPGGLLLAGGVGAILLRRRRRR